MGNISIRKLSYTDIEGVRNVDTLTQKVYLGNEWELLDADRKETLLKSKDSEFALNCESDYSFVALKNRNIVGFLFAHTNFPFSDTVIVRHIAVHPSYQRYGIGEKLFNTVIIKARREEKKAIRSSINPDNKPSIKLHESLGFEVTDWKSAILKL